MKDRQLLGHSFKSRGGVGKKLKDDPMNTICGAKTKKAEAPCKRLPKKNGKCRLHGGLSTGPKTADGIRKIQKSNTKHGRYTKEAFQENRTIKKILKDYKRFL